MMNKSPSHLAYCKARGNTLVEYSLIGVLMIAASIVVILTFGQNFRDRLAGLHGDMKYHNDQASLMQAQAQANMAMAGINGVGNAGGSGEAYDPAMAQTTGANGNQMILGTTGKEGAAGSKPLTPEQQLKSLLMQLSNQAHQVAQLQSLLESISKYSANDINKFKTSSIFYNNQVVNAWQLSWALAHGGEIAELEEKKKEVMASGASDSVKEKVAQLADQVTSKAAATSNAANDVLNSGSNPTAVSQVTNSAETHEDASKICKEAGQKDTGTSCTSILDIF